MPEQHAQLDSKLNIVAMAAMPETLFPERCLWQRHVGAACENCVQACPTGAIRVVDRVVSLDAEQCLGCGACLTACPVECFESDAWSERSLLQAADESERRTLEVVCKWHPAPQTASDSTPVVQVNACLAALSPGLWYELGLTRRIGAHLEHCAECPLAATLPLTESALARANQLLESSARAPSIIPRHEVTETAPTAPRKVIHAERRPISRRAFFFSFARSSGPPAQALACLPNALQVDEADTRAAPHQPAWLRRLAAVYAAQGAPTEPVNEYEGSRAANWPSLTMDATCVACGACARYCPSGALATSRTEGAFEHHFIPGVCIACGLCAHVCEYGSITRSYAADDTPFEERTIATMPVTNCPKCGGPAAQTERGLCLWCANEPPMHQLLENVRALFPARG